MIDRKKMLPPTAFEPCLRFLLGKLAEMASKGDVPELHQIKFRELPGDLYQIFDTAGCIPEYWERAGWHFCCELDGALVNHEDVQSFCECFEQKSSSTEPVHPGKPPVSWVNMKGDLWKRL